MIKQNNKNRTCLYQNTELEPPVYIFENKQYRWLTFGNTFIQSKINKKYPHKPIMVYIQALCCLLETRSPTSLLLLGSGGGALIHYLHHYYPNIQLLSIDKNSEVLALAKKFFHLEHAHLQQACALDFLQTNRQIYDYLFIDIFQDDSYPPDCATESFFSLGKTKTKQIVSANLLCKDEKLLLHIIHTIQAVFNNKTLCLFIKGHRNVVIHAFKEGNLMERLHNITMTGKVKNIHWTPNYGFVGTVKNKGLASTRSLLNILKAPTSRHT